MSKKKTPAIRFQGFTNEWKQRNLGDITSKIGSGKTPSGGAEIYVKAGTPLIRSQNVHDDLVDLSDVVFIDDATNKSMENSVVSTGDVLLNITGASIGRSAVYKDSKPANVNQHVCIIRPVVGYYPDFVQLHISSDNGQKQIYSSQAGGAREGLNFQQIGRFEFSFPSFSEQAKIGKYIRGLDNTIVLHQRKLTKLQLLKKSMLTKMFPKDGARVPEIRFQGFHGDWEQRKFAEIAKRESSFRSSSYENPSVEYEDVVAEEGRLIKDIRLKEITKTGISFDGTQVLYGKLRPYLHNWLNPDFRGVAVGDWWVLKPVEMDKNFLYRLIQTWEFDEIANQSTGSKMPRADWNLVSNSEFRIPSSLDEQRKIAGAFDNLDRLITLHQRKLSKLQQIKQAMLSKLFV